MQVTVSRQPLSPLKFTLWRDCIREFICSSTPGIAKDVLKMGVKKSLFMECENSTPLFFSALNRLIINLISPRQERTVFLSRDTNYLMSKDLQIVVKWSSSYQSTLLWHSFPGYKPYPCRQSYQSTFSYFTLM